MTTPNPANDDANFVQPDEVVSDVAPPEIVVDPVALEAAKAELAQEKADANKDVYSRSLRTAVQAAVAAAVAAGIPLVEHGVHDWKVLGWAGGQAAVTVLVTYFHGKLFPAKG